MKINNVLVANLNQTNNFMPYFKAEVGIFPSQFTDSPIQVLPVPNGYSGFTGIQTNMGVFLAPPPSPAFLPPYGMQLLNDNTNYGSYVRLGDYGDTINSSLLSFSQYPFQQLNSFFFRDSYDNTLYMEITPATLKYSFGNFTTSQIGMEIDGINGFAHLYLSQGIGLDINSGSRTVLIGQEETGARIGVDYQNGRMYVGNSLIEDNALTPSPRFIKVVTGSNEQFWIQLWN